VQRLTIDRPLQLGEPLAHAVRAICARRLDTTAACLALIDARLACGDFESVLALLRSASPAPALPLVAARYMRWTGDLQSVAAAWDGIAASLEPRLLESLGPTLHRAALIELAPAATDLGDAPLAARLLGAARTMHGESRDATNASLAATDAAAFHSTADDVERVRIATREIIGIDPDAARGRLRIRPRLDRFDELAIRNIRFGDGSIRFRAEHDGHAIVIRVEQESGSIPITLLLEPFVMRPGTVTIDGEPADLAPQDAGTGTIVPVQLVLDDARSMTIQSDPAVD
jgi:hypothetical protein